jgi:hypothetical protein
MKSGANFFGKMAEHALHIITSKPERASHAINEGINYANSNRNIKPITDSERQQLSTDGRCELLTFTCQGGEIRRRFL